MKAEAETIIFDYINLYKEYSKQTEVGVSNENNIEVITENGNDTYKEYDNTYHYDYSYDEPMNFSVSPIERLVIVIGIFLFLGAFILMVIALLLLLFEKTRKYGTCLLLWELFPFVFPYYAHKKDVIKKQWISWLIFLFTPFWYLVLCVWLIM